MPNSSEQPSQDFHDNPLLHAFDLIYIRTAERSALSIIPDEQQQREQTQLELLATLLLEYEKSTSKNSNTTPDGQRYLEQSHLVLDAGGLIESFSMSIPGALGYPTIRLAGRPFTTLLDEASINTWEGLLPILEGRISIHTVTTLKLLSLHRQAVPAVCTFSKLLNSDHLHVSCLFVLQHLPQDITIRNHHKGSRNDAALLQQLHDLILQNLDRPLPTIPQLAKQLGTNTFTLKDGFKHYFNMGIYQFYTQERLAKAKVMLLETHLSLPNIAEACGFSSASTFSKAFKKKYGIAPLQFKKMR